MCWVAFRGPRLRAKAARTREAAVDPAKPVLRMRRSELDYVTGRPAGPRGPKANSRMAIATKIAATASMARRPPVLRSGNSASGTIVEETRFTAQAVAVTEARSRVEI